MVRVDGGGHVLVPHLCCGYATQVDRIGGGGRSDCIGNVASGVWDGRRRGNGLASHGGRGR